MASLTDEQQSFLQSYGLTFHTVDSDLSIECKSLLEQDKVRDYLERLKEPLGAKKLPVSGSLLVKRYGLLASLVLYSMSMWNKLINVELDYVSLQSYEENGMWLPKFHFCPLEVSDMGIDRLKERTDYVKTLFKHHIDPIICSISSVAKISKDILWENVAVYIFWMYESIPLEQLSEGLKSRLIEDYQFIVKQAPGNVFGSYDKNPLSQFDRPKVFHDELQKEVRVRKTCCLYYATNDGAIRCHTCPIKR